MNLMELPNDRTTTGIEDTHERTPHDCPDEKDEGDHHDLLYKIDDTPPWYMCLLLGFQVNISG